MFKHLGNSNESQNEDFEGLRTMNTWTWWFMFYNQAISSFQQFDLFSSGGQYLRTLNMFQPNGLKYFNKNNTKNAANAILHIFYRGPYRAPSWGANIPTGSHVRCQHSNRFQRAVPMSSTGFPIENPETPGKNRIFDLCPWLPKPILFIFGDTRIRYKIKEHTKPFVDNIILEISNFLEIAQFVNLSHSSTLITTYRRNV